MSHKHRTAAILRKLLLELGQCLRLCLLLLPVTLRRSLLLPCAGVGILSLTVTHGRTSALPWLLVGLVLQWIWLRHIVCPEAVVRRFALPLSSAFALLVALLLWRDLQLPATVIQGAFLLSLLPELWFEGIRPVRIPHGRPLFAALILHISATLLPACGLLLALHPEHSELLMKIARSLMLAGGIAAGGIVLLGNRMGQDPRWWPIFLDKAINSLVLPWALLAWAGIGPLTSLIACALWLVGEWDSVSLVELWRRAEFLHWNCDDRANVEQDLL